ncbi:uncharacterized protein LOC132205118 [Neocloeon triangulifer]|uniref:uncharacterized protein LOC132205118 n=1 Tax=Neocloeon triangulifer TaxID=2078957 RepID=UPI00286F5219|nr:uncharacterized protein LOC132205118 [Neocloeon triangulifer]
MMQLHIVVLHLTFLLHCTVKGNLGLLFLPKTTFRVGMLINVPFDEQIFHGLMFRGNYPLYPAGAKSDLKLDRWTLYSTLEGLFDRMHLPGRPCLLRAVCEVAAHRIDHDGLLGEALHLLLSPSSSSENRTESWHRAYVRAERWGSKHRDCTLKFGKGCPKGVLQMFTTLG